jgi:hypothetical protein
MPRTAAQLDREIREALLKGPVASNDQIWAYHATTLEGLVQIRKRGLQPRAQPKQHRGEARATSRPAIFFAPTYEHARVWGPTIVRFPWPDASYEDPYSDSTLVDGEVIATHHYAFESVPPARVEEFVDGSWKPIGKARAPRRAHATISIAPPAILVTSTKSIKIPAGELEATMESLGFSFIGYNENPQHRIELRGAPKFRGVTGPMWGDEATPLRYETMAAYRELSR